MNPCCQSVSSAVLCTAAGREGINLQFARILFNYDLPWNPMDLEQRIGRIPRYGQQDFTQLTAFLFPYLVKTRPTINFFTIK